MKTCKVCKQPFTQYNTIQALCVPCAIVKGQKKTVIDRKKALQIEKRYLIEEKDRIKTKKKWADEAQIAFNAYIRARDGKICISCGTTKPDIQYCAGHYRTRGAASHLRYNEDNVNSQCNKKCNLERSGAISDYRPALIAKIGIERVEALENNNQAHTWTIEELKAIKSEYKAKLKEFLK